MIILYIICVYICSQDSRRDRITIIIIILIMETLINRIKIAPDRNINYHYTCIYLHLQSIIPTEAGIRIVTQILIIISRLWGGDDRIVRKRICIKHTWGGDNWGELYSGFACVLIGPMIGWSDSGGCCICINGVHCKEELNFFGLVFTQTLKFRPDTERHGS